MRTFKNKLAWLNMLLFLALLPLNSYATDVTSILQHTQSWLQGNVAKSVGIIAVIGCGYMCIFQQRLPKAQFLLVLVGLGVVFGASSLFGTLVA